MSRERTARAGPVAAALLALLAAEPVWALSMRHSAADARAAGVSPGGSYALGSPPTALTIANTGRDPAEVDLKAAAPGAGELRDGYEPIPGGSWLELDARRLVLRPGEERAVPALLTLPRRPDDLGQFQAQLVSESRSPDGGVLRLVSSVLVTLEDEDARAVEKARAKAERRPGVEIALGSREKTFVVRPGRRAPLDGALKVANVGEEKAGVVVTVGVPPPDGLPKGVEPAPNPRFVRVKKRVDMIPKGKVEELELEVEVPDQPRYRGRAWAFDVTVEALEREFPKTETLRLYVKTEDGQR